MKSLDYLKDEIWYDTEGKEFVEFSIENGSVVYHVPHDGDIYHEESVEEFDPDEFIKVDSDAVENPISFGFQKLEEFLVSENIEDSEEEVSIRYCIEYTDLG